MALLEAIGILLCVAVSIPVMMITMHWSMEVSEGKTEDTLRVRLIKAVKWLW